ncbi:hypothetical protein CRENBAI_011485 [Crenichthys baileyi]|uniref:Uncharacterized protein n=1 Tax=Crenichthys baileyi TaxID=28760 RepID=A0AAV9QXK6_9TELE
MRHRYAGAVHQHHTPDEKQGNNERRREQVAPVFSLPPPPSSHHRVRTSTTAAQRQNLQELPCVSQPSRRPVHSGDLLPLASFDTSQRLSHRGGEPSPGQPTHLQQDPWAPDGSQQPPPLQSERGAVFPSCHCSFSEQEASLSQNQSHPVDPLRPQPSPPFPPLIPPPPTSSSSSLLFSRGSERGDRLRRSANNYQQANTVERCRGGGGAGGNQDHRQLLQQQQQHCHLGIQQRDPSPEGSHANSQKGRSLDACESNEAKKAFESQTQDLQQQQIPQLRAQQQLLVGSSLPVNYCASGSGELCRTHRAPLLQQQEQQQLLQHRQQQLQQGAPGLSPQPSQQQHCDKDRNKCGRITAESVQAQPHSRGSRVTPPATPQAYAGNSSATGSHSNKDSPNYGSSYHLWPESPHKGEERIRIDLHKACFGGSADNSLMKLPGSRITARLLPPLNIGQSERRDARILASWHKKRLYQHRPTPAYNSRTLTVRGYKKFQSQINSCILQKGKQKYLTKDRIILQMIHPGLQNSRGRTFADHPL